MNQTGTHSSVYGMTLDPTTKLAKVREAMANGDWDTAIKLEAKFADLGEHKKVIQRARDAINNPGFYAQMGFDLDALKKQAIKALKERHSRSWSAAKAAKRKKPRKSPAPD